jgi:glyoxylase-like metal-dependent hydrolase (beta-lactamase superfamily II)
MNMARRTFLQRTSLAAGAAWMPGSIAKETPMDSIKLLPDLHILKGAVNTGVLVRDGKALLFDCCDSVTTKRLQALGVDAVEMILCTQHRRPNCAGVPSFVEGGAKLVVPAEERSLFEDADAYWSDWKNRWHLYHNQPGPQVLANPVAVTKSVGDGNTIEWRDTVIRVIDTPGATDGSVSYIMEIDGESICFCGDVLSGPGEVWDLHSLQKGFGGLRDYHGFLGNGNKLMASLKKLGQSGASQLVPSHGAPITDSASAIQGLEKNFDALWRNYTATSALNFYFKELFDDLKDDPQRMTPAQTLDPPAWVRRVAFTSFAVVSETGAALLIDCGHDSVLQKIQQWRGEKEITTVEGCWVTHYHDDHVDALHRVANELQCPIMTDRRLSEIIEHPQRFFLPCIAPCGAPVAKATEDGESWSWHEFKLTAFHFPGQTFYHAGLLVEGHGESVFFAGDSGAPSGLDDYCAGNRVFLGAEKGSRQCLDIWRKHQPDYIMNQHQDRAFHFTAEQLDYMESMLEKRENIINEMTPWDNANFAIDEWWLRTYPYQQDTYAGATIVIDVESTNHGDTPAKLHVEAVLPEGWHAENPATITIPAQTSGSRDSALPTPDHAARVALSIPDTSQPGQYIIPFRVTWNGKYLGQYRHAMVYLR